MAAAFYKPIGSRECVRQNVVPVTMDLPNGNDKAVGVRSPSQKSHGGPTKKMPISIGQLTQEAPGHRTKKPPGDPQRQFRRQGRYSAGPGRKQHGNRLHDPRAPRQLTRRADTRNEHAGPALEVPSHFQGYHSPQRNPTDDTGTSGVDMPGHPPGISWKIIARLGSNPTWQLKISELLSLKTEDPLVGPHA